MHCFSNLFNKVLYMCGPGSSVSIVTDYGLDGPGLNPGGDEIFRAPPVQPWGQPSPLYNGYRVPFSGINAAGAGRKAHTTHLAPRLKKEQSYTSTPPLGLYGTVMGVNFTVTSYKMRT
jgi:hypothetical protein